MQRLNNSHWLVNFTREIYFIGLGPGPFDFLNVACVVPAQTNLNVIVILVFHPKLFSGRLRVSLF